jgi:two-component system sensor kinase FixL
MSQAEKALVLVVDDHEPAAQMVSQIFIARGYDCDWASDGEAALEKAQRLLPDLILLDVMMPGMDGFQVLERLRANPLTANTPVIFVTAKDDPADIEQGLNLGADDYIAKPVKPREVLARARSKIEERRLQEALRQRTKELEVLLRFSEELNNYLDVQPLMDLILYLVSDLILCDAVILYRIGADQSILDIRQEKRQADLEFDSQALLDEILQSQQTTVVWENNEIRSSNRPAGMAVVLAHVEQLHGLLVVLGSKPYSERNRVLLEAISRQTTLALRNAELYATKVHYAEHLEEMVEARTRELRSAQELLSRAEKLASVGRLAAGIAHEINNPLVPIRINLELMLEDIEAGNPVSAQDVSESLNSVTRIARIIERLQQFTRKRGEEAPDMEPLSLSSVLEGVLALSRAFLRQSNINIETKLDNSAYIYGNRDQLEQVFLNIILNAQAAMENGGKLTIESKLKGKKVELRFNDTGHGIPADMLEKIFDPFVSTKENGSGLGLFISHNIIDNHSGQIQAESNSGKGASFILTLPVIENVQES